ncbi:guanylate cyclase [Leptospira kobayashii]|uniref:Guanylate cyclase n=1 Tax=Leptospira kobayashii TaxID=1917830 RepID=A0ABM7UHK1_9LEPT|nr:adenylate/guanylate cyclase domain-containing protein [Leptospira kobayashii]BDA78156.1 guanylate cyclase [Leptospira kobayashii]
MTSFWKKIDLKLSFKNKLSPTMIVLLEEEERNGAKVANQFRYLIGAAMTVSIIANLPNIDTVWGYAVNFGALFFYFVNTYIHAYILRCQYEYWVKKYEYISIFFDNFLVSITILNWHLLKGEGNPNFILKNPVYSFYLLPLALSMFQFRIRLVLFSFLCFFFAHCIFLAYTFHIGSPIGNDWYKYVLGDELIVTDAIVTRPIIYFSLAICLSYGIYRTILMLKRLANAEAQKTSLARYFSPDLVEEITSQPDVIQSGRRQKVTVLFSDIRNFTKMSESMDPQDLSTFLTGYRSGMTKAVFHFGGTLDKFIGDAVMATFGTPLPAGVPGLDSKNAVLAAKGMLAELKKFNLERESEGKPGIEIGIGIHTGEVFAGNIGTEERMEYTVIGDTVNTASRIESACKRVSAHLLISEEVWEEIGRPDDFRQTESILLAGKEKQVNLYKWSEEV